MRAPIPSWLTTQRSSRARRSTRTRPRMPAACRSPQTPTADRCSKIWVFPSPALRLVRSNFSPPSNDLARSGDRSSSHLQHETPPTDSYLIAIAPWGRMRRQRRRIRARGMGLGPAGHGSSATGSRRQPDERGESRARAFPVLRHEAVGEPNPELRKLSPARARLHRRPGSSRRFDGTKSTRGAR